MPRFRRAFAPLLATLFALTPIFPQAAHAHPVQPAVMITIPGASFNGEASVASRNALPRIGGTTDFIRFDASTNMVYITDGPNFAVDVFDTNAQAMVERINLTNGPHDAIGDDNLGVLMAPL